ncbi:hypothetical protein [Agarilytica rhodophyticola]|uniref:hypothetical protein n=1 Tax=Agarilytica rhodophyticola TaxID=1737490 RepID=UPI000B346769|nr:hypothetical protein [Agarilytica rhodophyticola]
MAISNHIGSKLNLHQLENDTQPQVEDIAPQTRVATLFRQVGIIAVVLSAVIYMLQGFDNVSLDFRQWTWPLLMIVMGIGGVVCRSFFDDVKSARIFFILSAALVSVQFSQLGGMLHEIFHKDILLLSQSWLSALSGNIILMTNIAISFALSMFLAYTCFSILVRKSSLVLTNAFMLLNILMLLPMRASFAAIAVVLVMVLIMAWLQSKIFNNNSAFKTREGIILRLLVLLPLIVSMARNSFHLDSITGVGVAGVALSFFIMYCLPAWFSGPLFKEVCLRFSALLAALSWFFVVVNISNSIALMYFLPLIGLSFELSRRSTKDKPRYRAIGSILFTGLAIFTCLPGEDLLAVTIILMASLTLLSVGVMLNFRAPIYAGVVCSVIALITLLTLSLSSVSINIWLALAVGGGILVLLSSIVEKYGRIGFQYFKRVKGFEY